MSAFVPSISYVVINYKHFPKMNTTDDGIIFVDLDVPENSRHFRGNFLSNFHLVV